MKNFFFVFLLLCLSGAASANVIDRLEEEGWKTVSPGVMQRTLEEGRVETLGFGADGLRFKIEEMDKHLAFLREEYAHHPSRELRRAIRAHRAEILRTEAALRKIGRGDGLASSPESQVANGVNCSANYDATGGAFALTSQGAGARADAYFDNPCGYIGEVYAHAYARATAANGAINTTTLSDPAPNTSRIGSNVTATASVSLNGVTDCYSYSYSTVTSYDLEVTYSQSATNERCIPRQVTISTPAVKSLQISPVQVVANATSPDPVTLLQIYLDGSKVYEVHDDELATDVPMAPGYRRLTVQAYDAAGTFKTTQYIDVCALNPASPSVTICAPADGATVSSPVRVLAGTTSARPVVRINIYIDGTKVYEEANHRLDRSLTLSPGTHRLTVQAFDDLGNSFKSTIHVTVSS